MALWLAAYCVGHGGLKSTATLLPPLGGCWDYRMHPHEHLSVLTVLGDPPFLYSDIRRRTAGPGSLPSLALSPACLSPGAVSAALAPFSAAALPAANSPALVSPE